MSSGSPSIFGGKYKVEQRLAKGGMGEVFLARHEGPGGFSRQVVIKTLLPDFAADDQFVEMFLQEARLVALLTHPNIVHTYDFGEQEGHYYIVMEYLDGLSVAALLKESLRAGRRITPGFAAALGSQVCSGLAYAASRIGPDGNPLNLVHRDISPQNLIVCADGSAKVLDFGIAKFSGSISKTETGALKGKPAYMSPEHTGKGKVDPRSDLFSLGIVLWELLAGKRLFKYENVMEMVNRICNTPAPRIDTVVPGIPQALASIVMRALEIKPERRFQSADEMARALDAFLFGQGITGSHELAAELKRARDPAAAAAEALPWFGSEVDPFTGSGSGKRSGLQGTAQPGVFKVSSSDLRRSSIDIAQAGAAVRRSNPSIRQSSPGMPAPAPGQRQSSPSIPAAAPPPAGVRQSSPDIRKSSGRISLAPIPVAPPPPVAPASAPAPLDPFDMPPPGAPPPAPVQPRQPSRPPQRAVPAPAVDDLTDDEESTSRFPVKLVAIAVGAVLLVGIGFVAMRSPKTRGVPDAGLSDYLHVALTVSSTPPGASILVDGTDTGKKTPGTVDLETGRDHKIRVVHPEYVSREESVFAAPRQPLNLQFPLEQGGRIAVNSEPIGATVLIDGDPAFKTPGISNGLPPGKHQVIVRPADPSLASDIREMVVKVGETAELGVALEPAATVKIASAPAEALVSLDGKPTGLKTPVELGVAAGREHVITLSLPGRETASRKVPALAAGKQMEMTVSLQNAAVAALEKRLPEVKRRRDAAEKRLEALEAKLDRGTFVEDVKKERKLRDDIENARRAFEDAQAEYDKLSADLDLARSAQ